MPTEPPASTDPIRSAAGSLFERYTAFAERRAGTILLLFALLAVATIYPITRLELHTDLAEILPSNHPAVIALKRISGRQRASTNLVVLISSPSEASNRKLAEALRPELQAMIPSVFSEIQWRPDTEVPEFARKHRWLYADKKDLLKAEDLFDRIVAERRNPLIVDLDGDPEAELKSLREKLRKKLPTVKDTPYFSGVDKDGTHYLGIMLWRHGGGVASLDDFKTLAAVEKAVARVHPASIDPRLKVEYTGHIAMAIDEHNAVRDDLTLATSLCVFLVLLSIFLYFRRFALLLVVGIPAVEGLLFALVLARYSIHYLNANTAFLISIILGNGINSPIILLARYGEERRAGLPAKKALTSAMGATVLATGTAMVAASISYGCLLLTSLRGFNQFGLVGGAGMLFVWTLTFVLVPPLVLFGERVRPGLLTPRPILWRRPFAWIGRLSERRAGLLAALSMTLLVASAWPLAHYLHDPLEWNFQNLRSDETGAQKRWAKMYQLGMGNVGAGYIGTDGVMLVDKPEQADIVAEALRKQDAALGKRSLLKAVRTIHSALPKDQKEKIAILERLRKKIDENADLMSDSERRDLDEFRPPRGMRPITIADLPHRVRDAFTETDGTVGRLIGIDADPTRFKDWNGLDLIRLARSMQVHVLGKTWVAASNATVFGGMLETIRKDGPRLTLAALGAVVVLLLVAFRGLGALPVIASLGFGLVWLGALLDLTHLKLNFVNFVALAITLGVGADYAANLWARLRREGTAHLADVVADTGSAVALCSLTTIIGYSSLLVASNRALKSFGLLADFGELTCLTAALVTLPALVRLLVRRGGKAESADEAVRSTGAD